MTSYVLDTNVWSDVARGIGKAGRKLSVVPIAQVFIAAPALYELRRVPKTSAAWSALDRFTTTISSIYEIAALDHSSAEAAARAANALRSKGRTLQHLDVLIAGVAISRGATLVTRDKDFASVPGLRIENWH